jgi:hypothetical protein
MKLPAALFVLAMLAAATSSPASTNAKACTPGKRKIGNTTVRVYCGPARAAVRSAGRAFPIYRGSCRWKPARRLYVVDVGIETLGGGPPKTRYLGIRTPSKRPGTYRDAAVVLQLKGKRLVLGPLKVTLTERGGSFSGQVLFGAGSARGSWTC